MDQSRPHTAVINVQIEVHALDNLGQCSGQTLSASTLERFDIKPSFLLRVDGKSAEECLNNLKDKVEKMNE